jgi:hypothetical protein
LAIAGACAGALLSSVSAPAAAAENAPAIRTSAANHVPPCATPGRLNAFLADQIRSRGYALAPRFADIAHWYRRHGEHHRVRWDYAFFQMALETNFLSFRRGDGRPGDVLPRQNNFAGLGTTGGGVRGDSYPDVATGVLAQIQHLVVYSGQRLANPIGHRTRLKQDVILQSVSPIARRRPVTFADLARRWAADRRYGRSINRLANLFYSQYCTATAPTVQAQALPGTGQAQPRPYLPARPARQVHQNSASPVTPPKPLPTPLRRDGKPDLTPPHGNKITRCDVQIASFGGQRAVLIENAVDDTIKLTALNVQPGFEVTMAANFIQSYAARGKTIGTFSSRDHALAAAHTICRQRLAGEP